MSAPNRTTPLKRPGIPTVTADLEARVRALERGVWPRTLFRQGSGSDLVDDWRMEATGSGVDPTNWQIDARLSFFPQGDWDSGFEQVGGGGLAIGTLEVTAQFGFTQGTLGSGTGWRLIPSSDYDNIGLLFATGVSRASANGDLLEPVWMVDGGGFTMSSPSSAVNEIFGPGQPWAWVAGDKLFEGIVICAAVFS